MKYLKYFLFLLVVGSFVSCQKPGCFEDGGAIVVTDRKANPFTKIELYNNINLVLKQDTVEKLKVEGGRHLLPNISTNIEGGALIIRNNISCNWLRNPNEVITVYASVKRLEEVLYNGSGNITSTNTLTSDRLFFYSHEGAGNVNVSMQAGLGGAYIHQENADITLSGSCTRFFSYTNARGTIDFKNLQVAQMVIEYGGVRDATIQVTDSLNAILYHTGNLYYKGSPGVKKVVHSSGQLLRLP
jgi:hypothetical protein